MAFKGKDNKLEAAKALLKSAWRTSESFIRNKTKVELLALEATNDVAWGPTGAQLHDLAEACFDAEKFRQVWAVLRQRFEGEPRLWRRTYKALLVTEHLLKNSSQHVVQTILDGADALEGLKQFKYLDENGKDHGINVSNRAKELCLLLANSNRIRAERVKARALKEKFRGASREDMAAVALSGAGGGGAARDSPWAPSSHQTRGEAGPAPAAQQPGSNDSSAADMGQAGRTAGHTQAAGNTGTGGGPKQAAPGGAQPSWLVSMAENDLQRLACAPGRSVEGSRAAAQEKPAPTAVTTDPVTATAQRIHGLRAAGLLHPADLPCAATSAASSLQASPGGSSAASPMPASSSYDDLAAVEGSGGSQGGKPSLAELMARRAGQKKKLHDVHIHPAIRAALGGAKPPPPLDVAALLHSKPSMTSQPQALQAAPPPAAAVAALGPGVDIAAQHQPVENDQSLPRQPPVSESVPCSPVTMAAVPQRLHSDSALQAVPAQHMPSQGLVQAGPAASLSLAPGSSPTAPEDGVGAAPSALDALMPGWHLAAASPPSLASSPLSNGKPMAAGSVSITVTAGAAQAATSPPALPIHLFAESPPLPITRLPAGAALLSGQH